MNERKRRIAFIVNPISGTQSKKDMPEVIEAVLDKDQFESRIIFTEYAGHAAEIAKACAAEQTDIVAAGTADHIQQCFLCFGG